MELWSRRQRLMATTPHGEPLELPPYPLSKTPVPLCGLLLVLENGNLTFGLSHLPLTYGSRSCARDSLQSASLLWRPINTDSF